MELLKFINEKKKMSVVYLIRYFWKQNESKKLTGQQIKIIREVRESSTIPDYMW